MNRITAILMSLGLILTMPACATVREVPGPPVEVLIPVPVPCEPVQVPAAVRPVIEAGLGIYDQVRLLLADREILEGENKRLRAANQNPCPTELPE